MNEEKYEVELTANEWNLILGGLIELPYKFSAELISKIHRELNKKADENNEQLVK